jgi:hypothetical protein
MKRLGISAVAVALACSVALAQPASPEKQAEKYFNRGNTAYNLGRFDEAVENFTKAYEVWSQPEYLYNIAQAHRLAGRCKQALHFYKRFRALKDADVASPLSPQKREEIDRFTTQLVECAAKADTTATAPPDTIDRPQRSTPQGAQGPAQAPDRPGAGDSSGTSDVGEVQRAKPRNERVSVAEPSEKSSIDSSPSPRSPSGSRMKVAGVATAGAGLGLVITGTIFGVMARSAQSDVEATVKSGKPFDPDRDASGRRDATISAVTLGVGAAALVTGGVLFFLGSRDSKPAASDQARLRIIPSVGVATAGLTLDVRY